MRKGTFLNLRLTLIEGYKSTGSVGQCLTAPDASDHFALHAPTPATFQLSQKIQLPAKTLSKIL